MSAQDRTGKVQSRRSCPKQTILVAKADDLFGPKQTIFGAKADDLTKADDPKKIIFLTQSRRSWPKQTILFSLFLYTKADDLSEEFKNKTRRSRTK